MTRARSLSLLANANAFTVSGSNNVGIGSTLPDVKLDVDGNMNVSGTLTYEDVTNVETAGITTTGGLVVTGLGATIGGITTFFGDINFGAAGVGGTVTTLGHGGFTGIVTALGFQATGVVTAASFRGDGSQLSGVDSSNLVDSGDTNRVAANTSGVVITGISTIEGRAKISSSEAITLDNNAHTGETLFLRSGGTAGAGNTQALLAFGKADSGSLRTGSALGSIQTDSDADRIGLAFYTSPGSSSSQTLQEKLRVTHDGNVLVAKTTTALDTAGSRVSSGFISLSGDSSSTNLATNSGGAISLANVDSTDNNFSNIGGYNSNGLVVNQIDFINKSHSGRTGEIAFLTHSGSNLVERLRIASDGKISQGGHTPSYEFDLRGTGLQSILIGSENAGGAMLILDGDSNGDGSGTDYGSISHNSDGNIEINNRKDAAIVFKNTSSETERLRITSSGRVGIATVSPDSPLEVHVGNGSGVANTLVLTRQFSSNYCAITWKTEAGGTTDWSLGQNDAGDFEVFHAGADAQTAFTIKDSGSGAYHVLPGGDNAQDLGSSSLRWANVYSADLQLSNEGSSNDVDGTWGQYTIQEGEDDLFLLNRRNGKKYKFMLEEVN
jgi:hypothetical protein